MKLGPAGEAYFAIPVQDGTDTAQIASIDPSLFTSPAMKPLQAPELTLIDIELTPVPEQVSNIENDVSFMEEIAVADCDIMVDDDDDDDEHKSEDAVLWWSWDWGRPSIGMANSPSLETVQNLDHMQQFLEMRAEQNLNSQQKWSFSYMSGMFGSLFGKKRVNEEDSESVKSYLSKEEKKRLEEIQEFSKHERILSEYKMKSDMMINMDDDNPSPITIVDHIISKIEIEDKYETPSLELNMKAVSAPAILNIENGELTIENVNELSDELSSVCDSNIDWGNESLTDEELLSLSNMELFLSNNDLSLQSLQNIRMSECAHLLSKSMTHNKQIFTDNEITHDILCNDPSLIFNPNLIILHGKRLYPGSVALPLLMSIMCFGKPLSAQSLLTLVSQPTFQHMHNANKVNINQKNVESKALAVNVSSDVQRYWAWFRKPKKRSRKIMDSELKQEMPKLDLSSFENDNISDIHSSSVLYVKSLRPTSEMLSKLPLMSGANEVIFSVNSRLQGTQTVVASIYLWEYDAKIVISDVDGTITKSDVMGHVAPFIVGYAYNHSNVQSLFSKISNHGYELLYLTSRGISQSSITRSYLTRVELPLGPIIMSPSSLFQSLRREVIDRTPQTFKIPALRDVRSLFSDYPFQPFYAAFGNRMTDSLSYLDAKVNVPLSRIFIIDSKGKINTHNNTNNTNYQQLAENVDSIFVHRCIRTAKEEDIFNSFNYWSPFQLNIPLPDLTDTDTDSNTD